LYVPNKKMPRIAGVLECWRTGVLDSDSARILFALVNPSLQSSIIPIFPLELSSAVRAGGWGYLNFSHEFLSDPWS
jgi:hypothetical protein